MLETSAELKVGKKPTIIKTAEGGSAAVAEQLADTAAERILFSSTKASLVVSADRLGTHYYIDAEATPNATSISSANFLAGAISSAGAFSTLAGITSPSHLFNLAIVEKNRQSKELGCNGTAESKKNTF